MLLERYIITVCRQKGPKFPFKLLAVDIKHTNRGIHSTLKMDHTNQSRRKSLYFSGVTTGSLGLHAYHAKPLFYILNYRIFFNTKSILFYFCNYISLLDALHSCKNRGNTRYLITVLTKKACA